MLSPIANWLSTLGFEQYSANFEENDIDLELLVELTEGDLKELGVASLGHRKKILSAIEKLHKPAPGRLRDQPLENQQTSAERREVTTVFADLSDYTKLSRELETEDLHNVLSVFYDRFDDIVSQVGGTVERHIGDCVMAVFGAPVSYGNDTEHALRASLMMHSAMIEVSRTMSLELDVHIGVAGGNVIFSRQGLGSRKSVDAEFTLTGDSVNLASRLADEAEGKETLITERIYNALGAQIECDEPHTLRVKGFQDDIKVFRFIGFRQQLVSRPLIGREKELETFQQLLSHCIDNQQGVLLGLIGEAGLGKTHLVNEFEKLATGRGMKIHKSLVFDFGVSESQDPIRVLLRSVAGLEEKPSATEEFSNPVLLTMLGLALTEAQKLLLGAMTDEARTKSIWLAICDLFKRASVHPLLVVLEDVHWADPGVLDLLAQVIRAAIALPVTFVLTSRVANNPLLTDWLVKAGEPVFKELSLEPLNVDEARRLAAGADTPLPDDVIASCVERAEGNPLFLDQLLRHARDEGFDTVPGSIQSIIQARLDNLAMSDREVLEASAVLGQRFDIQQATEMLGFAAYSVNPLVTAGLIQAIPTGFLFSHALIRDAVLRTILRDDLQELHKKAAALFKDSDPGLFAEHLAEAQDKQAPAAFLAAAEAARLRHLKQTALALADRGILLAPGIDVEVQLLDLKGDMQRDLGQGEAAIEAYEAALAKARTPEQTCEAQIGIISAMRIMDRIDEAYELLDDVETVATAADLPGHLSEIHYLRGSLHFPRGNLDGCMQEHEKSLLYAERADLAERRALALSGLGDAHYATGRMFTAHGVIEACLNLCREHGLVAVEAANRFMLATVKIYMNETLKALEEAKASAEIAARVGHSRAEIVSRLTTGWIDLSMNKHQDAQKEIELGLALARQLGAKRFEPFLEETLAGVALATGHRLDAETIAEDALLKVRQLDAMSFIGPWVISTAARATSSDVRRHTLLEEGSLLLQQGCVGHNYYRFYVNAMEACLDAREFDRSRHYAEQLSLYTKEEPSPWADLHVARVLALADSAEGNADATRLTELRRQAEAAHLYALLPLLDLALEGGSTVRL